MKKRKMMVLLMSVCLAAGSIGCGGQAPAAAPPSGEQQTAEDKKFHYTIYRLSHNQVMYQLILSISGVMDKFWEFPLNMEDPFLESLPLHEELYNAMCEKNVKKAQAINEKLLDAVYRDIRNQR